MWIWTHPFAKRSKMVCFIVTRRPLGQRPKGENSALLECRSTLQMCCSTLQKCWIGSWTLNALSCSGVVWAPFLGFFDQSLHLDAFSSSVYNFFIFIFLNNLGFFRNNYLIDKYPKISLDKVHIIHNFIVIQSSLLFLCMHPYFKHYYQPITKLFN